MNRTYEWSGQHHVVAVITRDEAVVYVGGERVDGSMAVYDRALSFEDIRRHVEAHGTAD